MAGAAWKRVYEPASAPPPASGACPTAPDPDRYANRFAHCDVLVIGAGPAGLAAATAAAASGARVMLCDEQAEFGGSLLADTTAGIDGVSAADWVAAARCANWHTATTSRCCRARRRSDTYAQNFVALAERLTDHLATPPADAARERLWQVRAREVVLATGAIERPLVFPGNDRPGHHARRCRA